MKGIKPPKPGQPGYENPKFLKPGTGKPYRMPVLRPDQPGMVKPKLEAVKKMRDK